MWKIDLFDIMDAAVCISLFCILEYLHKSSKEELKDQADKIKMLVGKEVC